MVTEEIEVPLGTSTVRYCQLLWKYDGIEYLALEEAESDKRFKRVTPRVVVQLRSAVSPIATTSTGAPVRSALAPDFLPLLGEIGAVERLRSRMFPGVFYAKTPYETGSPGAGWVAEGRPISVNSASFGSVTLQPTKVGKICVVTEELMRMSSPDAERTITRILRNAVSYGIDNLFLDPSIAGVSGQNPPSATYGGAVVVSSGTTTTLIATDLSNMVAALGSWHDPAWFMRPRTLAFITAHSDGALLTYQGSQPFLLGYPVFVTEGSPSQVALIDLGAVVIATDDDALEVSVSRAATVELDTVAGEIGDSSPVTDLTNIKSFFQNNLVGIRILRFISWQRMQSTAAVTMVTTY